jgi:hypothetical protein
LNAAKQPPDLNVLLVLCPFCRQEHADDLECLDSGRLDTLRCQNPRCAKYFSFLIRECLACGEESVFTWTSTPAPTALAGIFCQHCGAPFDAARETEVQDAAQRFQ